MEDFGIGGTPSGILWVLTIEASNEVTVNGLLSFTCGIDFVTGNKCWEQTLSLETSCLWYFCVCVLKDAINFSVLSTVGSLMSQISILCTCF